MGPTPLISFRSSFAPPASPIVDLMMFNLSVLSDSESLIADFLPVEVETFFFGSLSTLASEEAASLDTNSSSIV